MVLYMGKIVCLVPAEDDMFYTYSVDEVTESKEADKEWNKNDIS